MNGDFFDPPPNCLAPRAIASPGRPGATEGLPAPADSCPNRGLFTPVLLLHVRFLVRQ